MAKQTINTCSNDDLDLVKASARAWHQHGSSSEGKPIAIRESDVTRCQRDPGPSRDKLEAIRNTTTNNNNNMEMEMEMEGSVPIHKSLLDPYEIESISKRLDQLIGLSGVKFYHELLRIDAGVNDDHPKKKSSSTTTKWKGFLQRRAVVCGRNHKVEETALRPKNHVTPAKTVNCKPRAANVGELAAIGLDHRSFGWFCTCHRSCWCFAGAGAGAGASAGARASATENISVGMSQS